MDPFDLKMPFLIHNIKERAKSIFEKAHSSENNLLGSETKLYLIRMSTVFLRIQAAGCKFFP